MTEWFSVFHRVEHQEPPPLTDEEIRNALTTENHQVIDTLYSLTCTLYGNESDRSKSIDGKAAALFGFVGAFISAIFVVLGFLGDAKNAKLANALSGYTWYVLVAALVVLGVALLALFFAVVVKKGWKAPGERDLFEAVHKYDGHIPGKADNHEKPAHDYKRHLIEHFWKLYKACFRENESKAQALFFGQVAVFVGLLLLIAVQVTAVLAFRSDMTTPKDSNPAPTKATGTTAAPPSAPDGRPSPLQASSKGTITRDGVDQQRQIHFKHLRTVEMCGWALEDRRHLRHRVMVKASRTATPEGLKAVSEMADNQKPTPPKPTPAPLRPAPLPPSSPGQPMKKSDDTPIRPLTTPKNPNKNK